MRKKSWAAVCGLFLYLAPLSGGVYAADVNEQSDMYRQKIEEAQKKRDALDNAIDTETNSEKKRALDEAAQQAQEAYDDIKGRLENTDARIQENEAKLNTVRTDYTQKQNRLAKRVRDIYINGQVNYLDVLFGAKDFQDFFTRMDLLKKIIGRDYALLQMVFTEKQDLENTQATLAQDRKSQDALLLEAARKKKDADEKKQAQDALIEQMKTDRATQERVIAENMAASQEVAKMIQNETHPAMASSSVDYVPRNSKGGFIWPISGSITSNFGWRVHPITGIRRLHAGIDIGGDYGQIIHAAAGGIVSYAGWISGYGNAVIIDHGGGISTLYGHSQKLLVREGQSVAQGDAIAEVGSTGNSTGPHCHFEVRRGGEPVNPLSYL